MTDLKILERVPHRDAVRREQLRRARRRHRARAIFLVIVVGAVALLAFMAPRASGPSVSHIAQAVGGGAPAAPKPITRGGYGASQPARQLRVALKLPLGSGLLFDVGSGRVLWQRDPQQALPIASLTKMMTALVVIDHGRLGARVPITRVALSYSGSGVGLLPLGKRVPLEALLYGLMLPSGNDAAIALAQFVGGSQQRFVAMMNARADAMGLSCTHFSSVSGIVDRGNYSCALDLAALAHAVLGNPLLGQIVASRSAVLPFPIKGGKLYLYNNNPLLVMGYPGTNGVKTGYTTASGPCLVATARRGRTWLGVVLLHSANPAAQAQSLLNAGFATHGS
jgi:serine-type D-Ala-D-Ala carboxypeptidase (penicillin-binding protein 5/6)